MPKSDKHQGRRTQDTRQQTPKKRTPEPDVAGRTRDFPLGGDFSQSTFERHAALLGDVRLSQLSNTLHRAMIVRQLQRDYGNRYVQRLIDHISRRRATAVQTKLTVGPAGDKYEQEADSVAQEVMGRLSAPNQEAAQREGDEEEELQMKAVAQRQGDMDAEEAALMEALGQPQVPAEGGTVTPDVERTIGQASGGGQSLPGEVKSSMEGAFGADFSGVKVHTDAQADSLNNSLNSVAFTTGQDIFFRKGDYNPSTSGGQELLAHELTHVVQQSSGRTFLDERPNIRRHTGTGRPLQRGWSLFGGGVAEEAPTADVAQEGEGKNGKLQQAAVDEVTDAKLSEWVTGLFDFVKSSFGNINSKVTDVLTEEAKDKGRSEEEAKAEGEKEFKQRMPFNSAMGDFFEGVGEKIENGLNIFPGIIKLFSSVVQANKSWKDRKKELEAIQNLEAQQRKQSQKTAFSDAIAYSVKKAFRSACWRAVELGTAVVQGISRAVSAVAAVIPGAVFVAAVSTGIDVLIGLGAQLATLGSKLKGLWKWVTGTRGKARAENAGVIVDTALGGSGAEKSDAAQLIGSLKPDGLVDILSSNTGQILDGLNGATTGQIDQLKEGMADKLKSS
jgi:hypothetical protein